MPIAPRDVLVALHYGSGKKEWPRSFELISAPNHLKEFWDDKQ
jgi:hypothetical protein